MMSLAVNVCAGIMSLYLIYAGLRLDRLLIDTYERFNGNQLHCQDDEGGDLFTPVTVLGRNTGRCWLPPIDGGAHRGRTSPIICSLMLRSELTRPAFLAEGCG